MAATHASDRSDNGNARISGITEEEAAYDFMKERLMNDAKGIDDRDLEQIEREVPKKVDNIKALTEGIEWLKSMLSRVTILYEMVRDAEYKLDRRSKALIAAGLIYFLLPVDMTPDFIPGIGYLDDAVVLSTLWKIVQEQVTQYMIFKEKKALGG
jgi:uncharacterized membrane protein YkvA (DUF1232 family)